MMAVQLFFEVISNIMLISTMRRTFSESLDKFCSTHTKLLFSCLLKFHFTLVSYKEF